MTLFQHTKSILLRSALAFLAFLIVGVLLVTLAYAIPNRLITENANKSIEMIKNEYQNDPSREWSGMFDETANTINYGCDRKWMRRAIIDDPALNALEAAMSVNSYTRYWHGYQVFVRPMLVLGTYEGMVYVSVFCYLALLLFCFTAMKKRLGAPCAFAFFFALYWVRIFATSVCLNNSGCFISAMALTLFVLHYADTDKERLLYPLFLLAGMFVNYIDVLTAPLVSLGLPLAVLLLCKLRGNTTATLADTLVTTASLPVFWGFGYGVFWALKWLLASVVLGRNVISDAVSQAEFRIAGNALYATTPVDAIIANLAVLMPGGRPARIALLFLCALALLLLLLFHKPVKRMLPALPLLLVAAFPFVWMIVLSNHSEIHAPFVYRILAVTLFSLFAFVLIAIDWTRLGALFCPKRRDARA